jgi:hypothetical protein
MRPFAAFLCIALVTAGCGGAGAEPPGFRGEAARLCNDANLALDRIPLPAGDDFDAMVPVLEESARIHGDLVDDLRALEPPPADAQAVSTWLATAAAAVDSLQQANAAVRSGQIDASLAPYNSADRLGTDAAQRATDLGLDGCFIALSPG